MRWLLAHTPVGAVNVSWLSVSSDTIDNMATTKIALFGTFVTYHSLFYLGMDANNSWTLAFAKIKFWLKCKKKSNNWKVSMSSNENTTF